MLSKSHVQASNCHATPLSRVHSKVPPFKCKPKVCYPSSLSSSRGSLTFQPSPSFLSLTFLPPYAWGKLIVSSIHYLLRIRCDWRSFSSELQQRLQSRGFLLRIGLNRASFYSVHATSFPYPSSFLPTNPTPPLPPSLSNCFLRVWHIPGSLCEHVYMAYRKSWFFFDIGWKGPSAGVTGGVETLNTKTGPGD